MADAQAECPPIVLAFAASDPSGGAGLQADLLTLASMGCHPLSVVTALTVQDTAGVENILAIDSDWVADQARCLLEDMQIDAIKIGVLGSVENIAAIAEIVSDYPGVPLVLDPVLASGRGDELASDEMMHALTELLLPHATLLTPNSMEARRLAEVDDDGEPSLAQCAERLIIAGCDHVLITGTHEATAQVVNTLYAKSGVVRSDSWPRLPGKVAAALEGGASAIQYRNKDATASLRQTQALALARLHAARGALYLVNDDPMLAANVGADGVHLGEDDASIMSARELLGPDRIIRVSCYNDFEHERA